MGGGGQVWSAGAAPVKFVAAAALPIHERGGRIVVDDYLRVPGHEVRPALNTTPPPQHPRPPAPAYVRPLAPPPTANHPSQWCC
eukprot:SAG11_NODE_791_length_7146_cov_49.170427_2_plen_84_part_00